MRASNRFLLFLLMTGLFLCWSAPAIAAPTLTISPSGNNGIFVLTGTGFPVISGATIVIRYDTSTLANPRVTPGKLVSGAIFIPSTTTQGVVHIGLVALNGIPGSGVVASIAFDVTGSSPGIIQSLVVNEVTDLNGRPVVVRVQVINPSLSSPPASETVPAEDIAPTASTGKPQPTAQTGTGSGVPAQLQLEPSTAATAGGKGVEETTRAEQPAVTTEQPTAAETAVSEPTPPSKKAAAGMGDKTTQPEHVAFKSVLEQFRALVGKETPKSLTDIFSRHTMPGIRQEPAIALADGTSKLRISITLQSPGKGTPNFALKNADMVALKIGSDGSWLIDVLPAKGSYNAALTVLQGRDETEIPLLVAPPLPSGSEVKLTDAGFAQFLADRGTEKAPRFDLNGDGRRDYLDDYIFTANYLVRKGSGQKETSGKPLPKKLPDAGRQ